MRWRQKELKLEQARGRPSGPPSIQVACACSAPSEALPGRGTAAQRHSHGTAATGKVTSLPRQRKVHESHAAAAGATSGPRPTPPTSSPRFSEVDASFGARWFAGWWRIGARPPDPPNRLTLPRTRTLVLLRCAFSAFSPQRGRGAEARRRGHAVTHLKQHKTTRLTRIALASS